MCIICYRGARWHNTKRWSHLVRAEACSSQKCPQIYPECVPTICRSILFESKDGTPGRNESVAGSSPITQFLEMGRCYQDQRENNTTLFVFLSRECVTMSTDEQLICTLDTDVIFRQPREGLAPCSHEETYSVLVVHVADAANKHNSINHPHSGQQCRCVGCACVWKTNLITK